MVSAMPSIRRSPRHVEAIFLPHRRRGRAGVSVCLLVALLAGGTAWGGDWALGWSETLSIGGVSLRSRDPILLVGPDEGVHLLRIMERAGEPPRLVHEVSHDHSSFSIPATITCAWRSPRRLQAAIDAQKRIHLVWIDRVEELPAIYYAAYDPGTTECSFPLRVSSYASRIASPQIAVAGDGKTLIGWVEEIGQDNGVFLATVTGGTAGQPILLGEPAPGIRLMQFVVARDRVWLAWASAGRLPNVESLALQEFAFDGTPIGASHVLGELSGQQARPFCLASDVFGEAICVAFVGTTAQWQGRHNQILVTRRLAASERAETWPTAKSTEYIGSPWIAVRSAEEVDLMWEQGVRSFDVWYGAISGRKMEGGCLSARDGSSHFFPKVILDRERNLHAAWLALEAGEGQDYSLRYCNTVYPTPLGFWRRIGIPERGAVAAVFYSLVYTFALATWLVPLLNLGTLAVVIAVVLLLKRYFLGTILAHSRYLGLLLPFSMTFASLTPANPIFIDPPFVQLVFSPAWFGAALFAVPTLLTFVLVRLLDLDVEEPMSLIGAMLFWTICLATLSALPTSLLGVYP